ncbi:hypothetical protein J0J30_23445, partial [Vibrio vulnificus]|nr:hypothetical protein [Vibrio vulnificus]
MKTQWKNKLVVDTINLFKRLIKKNTNLSGSICRLGCLNGVLGDAKSSSQVSKVKDESSFMTNLAH